MRLRVHAKPLGPFGIVMAPVWVAMASALLYIAAFFVMVAGMLLLRGDATSVAAASFCVIAVFMIGGASLYCYLTARLALGRYLTLKAGSSTSVAAWRISIAVAAFAALLGLILLSGAAAKSANRTDVPGYVFAASIVSVSALWLYQSFRAMAATKRPTRYRVFLIALCVAREKHLAEAPPPPLVSIVEAKRRAGQAYMRVADCPRLGTSKKITNWSLLAPHLYALFLCSLGLSPGGIALRDHWVQIAAPVTQLVATVLPSIGKIGADLVSRGYGARAAFVMNVLAFCWILFAPPIIVACINLFPERCRLEKAERAWYGEFTRCRPGGKPWWRSFAPLFLVALIVGMSWYGKSVDVDRGGFDFANNYALFVPGLMLVASWWVCLYCVWLYALPKIARLSSRGSKGLESVRTR